MARREADHVSADMLRRCTTKRECAKQRIAKSARGTAAKIVNEANASVLRRVDGQNSKLNTPTASHGERISG